ncbi:hypothetical protein RB195_004778 [Necator americanus]|uniref:Uncharacterized protein n=1 Tax=Necator americanus TaxID=51031 RepID=A0ABR1BJL8_NECAM
MGTTPVLFPHCEINVLQLHVVAGGYSVVGLGSPLQKLKLTFIGGDRLLASDQPGLTYNTHMHLHFCPDKSLEVTARGKFINITQKNEHEHKLKSQTLVRKQK